MGTSCFPISPGPRLSEADNNVIDKNDQIIKIAQIIEADPENIQNPSALNYVTEVRRNTTKISSIK
jgi:hypothetical protein